MLKFLEEKSKKNIGNNPIGNILEEGTPEEIFGAPKKERTREFLSKVL